MKSRQLEILLYLLDVKKTTCAALARRFEVSRRTILRDLDKLSAMGIPVWTQAGYEGGVFLSPDYRFDRSFFTSEEIGDIILAFHLADHLRQGQGKQSALHKLELLVPELAFLKELDLKKYLKLELLSHPVNIQTAVCREINAGLDEEVLLQLTVQEQVRTAAPPLLPPPAGRAVSVLRRCGADIYPPGGADPGLPPDGDRIRPGTASGTPSAKNTGRNLTQPVTFLLVSFRRGDPT